MRRLSPKPLSRSNIRGRQKPGRRPKPRWYRRHARLLSVFGLGGVLLAGTAWLWHSGWVARQAKAGLAVAYGMTADAGFSVEDVLVEGRRRTDPAAILAALDVERGTPILALDPAAARARLEALPWVSRAAIERRLPRMVYLRLVEREPLALWQLDGEVSVIDQNGERIPGIRSSNFAELPLVVGAGANEHAAALLAMLEREPDLNGLVAASVRVAGRRWNLRLNGGVDVRLPENDAGAAWSHFARIEREHRLLQRDVVAIDLRLPDRLVVRTAPGATVREDETKPGRNT